MPTSDVCFGSSGLARHVKRFQITTPRSQFHPVLFANENKGSQDMKQDCPSRKLVALIRLRKSKSIFVKNLIHFSICACHTCAGAMLIFSV